MSENNSKKYAATFMNVVNAKNKDKSFYFAAVRGMVSKFETRVVKEGTPDEKKIVVASMPVNGRSKLINTVLGADYKDEDTVWLDITFWNPAERIIKYLEKSGNPERIQMFLTGALSLNKYQKNDGSEGKNVRLMVSDFNVIKMPVNNESMPPATDPTSAEEATDDCGFDADGYVDLDGSEDDLPF